MKDETIKYESGETDAPHCEYMHAHKKLVEDAKSKMADENTLFDLAELFKIFGDSTRIKILYTLSVSEMCVCDIAQILGMTISAVSHQLSVLRRSKLVGTRREGKTIFYSLADDHVTSILAQGYDHITE
ncbi:MAG: helix-turn-helix transcriptional regulator [Clostridia bacterium]|nr:helix-turn-helix transcriptional regulator [Clostridia bacterium]